LAGGKGRLRNDDVRHGHVEERLRRLADARLEPSGIVVAPCDDDDPARVEEADLVLDRLQRIGVAGLGLDLRLRDRGREPLGPLSGFRPGVVLGVREPVEPLQAGSRPDDTDDGVLGDAVADGRSHLLGLDPRRCHYQHSFCHGR